jgi:hypothetical protein
LNGVMCGSMRRVVRDCALAGQGAYLQATYTGTGHTSNFEENLCTWSRRW